MEQVIKLFFCVLSILAMCWIDDEHLDDGDYIENHASRVFLRIIIAMSIGYSDISYTSLIDEIGCGLILAFWFSPMFNIWRGKPFLYLGNTANFDKFFNKRTLLYKTVLLISVFSGITLILC